MKIKFSIHYNTAWGESLHIVIDYHSNDGTLRRQNLPMQTADGWHWTLETSALVSRQHPLSHIVYSYQVEDTEGRLLRREWDDVPRIYHFDASKDYCFPDLWRDRPLAYHLYSHAYLTTTLQGGLDEQVRAVRLPLFRRTVVFRVSAPQLRPGQAVAVCGSHPAIGSWSVNRYLPLQHAGRHEWMLSVNAMGWLLPVEYKYVVIDEQTHELVDWEEGDNRVIDNGQLTMDNGQLPDGTVMVLHGGHLRVSEEPWRVAGVAVPVFSLRSEHSCGVGDFGDLRRLVDWAVKTGMRVIQTLPVNDTTTSHQWNDSHPYNIVSAFALHPHYVDLEEAGTLHSKERMTGFQRQRQELNALSHTDYEAVDRVKTDYLRQLFSEQGNKVLATTEAHNFVARNEHWLKPYAGFRGEPYDYVCYVQFLLHRQLKAAADYARRQGVALMGDLPVGMSRDSVEARQHPELFHMDMQAGTPPDALYPNGQNWGFPTYNWEQQRQPHTEKEEKGTADFFRQRLSHLEQYFDAMRLDHVLGYFRIWEIPTDAVYGQLGHFSPSLPLTIGEIEYFGLPFRRDLLTRPFINDRLLDRLFGMHAQYVRDNFLTGKGYQLYDLREEFSTQRRVVNYFCGRTDENSIWIRDGLMRLLANVLFVEDPRQPDMFHPRIGANAESVFDALNSDEKEAYMRLYNSYFLQRHDFFWGRQALLRLTAMLGHSRMLMCAEDLGPMPACVEPVLDQLRMLTLQVQQMPRQQGFEFAHLEGYPQRSLCTISTHDMPPLRLWWMEQPERRQRFYVTMLQKEGRAPEQLPAHLAEEIIARHLYCPSMMCVLQLQDWLAMDAELRGKHPQEERINMPADAFWHWQYRMHISIEQLMEADKYNNKVRTMILRSKR